MKKNALVLSGGGFKGAFQLGALQHLKEHWNLLFPDKKPLQFDLVAGISVGSINGLMLASDNFGELEQLWSDIARKGVEEIYTSDFIDTRSPEDNLSFKINLKGLYRRFLPNISIEKISLRQKINLMISKRKRQQMLEELLHSIEKDFLNNFKNFKSLADNSPLTKKVHKYAKIEAIKDCTFICGYVSLNDGKYYSFKHTDFTGDSDFANAILASATMPIIWSPVSEVNSIKKQDRNLVDGGIRDISPLEDVIRYIKNDPSDSEYTVLIINCSSGEVEFDNFDDKNIAQIALRALYDITMSEIFNNDIKQFINKNFILEQLEQANYREPLFDFNYDRREKGKQLKHFQSIVIQPGTSVLGDPLVANHSLIERRIAHGQQKAAQVLKKIDELKGDFNFVIS